MHLLQKHQLTAHDIVLADVVGASLAEAVAAQQHRPPPPQSQLTDGARGGVGAALLPLRTCAW